MDRSNCIDPHAADSLVTGLLPQSRKWFDSETPSAPLHAPSFQTQNAFNPLESGAPLFDGNRESADQQGKFVEAVAVVGLHRCSQPDQAFVIADEGQGGRVDVGERGSRLNGRHEIPHSI
ncbi:hypothetical protein ONR75_17475 [Rhodopseudomonas sp. P2A-2r]|uniref:hypothetical protein n=1 Tax=Rhodopseudomonas sp. P2A-2r TaxID=2991972 RepID=UPI0022343FF9|nr:hypothetical protein [Rhodopseudomonas sp. P2A-2r]UZE52406.1 hypothetical protein ONR75_17475 [Rhodopseudomonas sp. P2A-2r]